MSERHSIHHVAELHDGAGVKGLARHTIGLTLLLCMVFFWTGGGFLNSSIFADHTYAKPFFIAYFNTSVFMILRIPAVVWAAYKRYRTGTLSATITTIFSRRTLRVVLRGEATPDVSYCSERASLLRSGQKHDSLSAGVTEEDDGVYLNTLSTARYAFMYSVLWLSGNLFCTACLQYTTVASSMILGATSSLWALLVGALTHTEKFTWLKFAGVCGSVIGIALISSSDLKSGTSNAEGSLISYPYRLMARSGNEYPDRTTAEIAIGDFLALLSATAYGVYVVFLKRATLDAHPRDLHMPTFFGFMGMFNIILLFPFFPILHFTGYETFELPPTQFVWTIVISLGLCNYLSDIFMAYAMVFTSPLLVTVALSMTIPLSLVGEMILRSEHKGWLYWLGAMIVVGSFIFVDREETKDDQEAAEEHARRSLESSVVLGHAHEPLLSGAVDIHRTSGDSSEKKQSGKGKMVGEEVFVVDDIGYGSIVEISVHDIGSSGPSSLDRRLN